MGFAARSAHRLRTALDARAAQLHQIVTIDAYIVHCHCDKAAGRGCTGAAMALMTWARQE
jgi:hypothetical protein